MIWAEEWAKEGNEIDWQKLLPPRCFEVLPRRWVVERAFAWVSRFRRLVQDYERLPGTVVGLHFVAFTCLMLHRAITMLGSNP